MTHDIPIFNPTAPHLSWHARMVQLERFDEIVADVKLEQQKRDWNRLNAWISSHRHAGDIDSLMVTSLLEGRPMCGVCFEQFNPEIGRRLEDAL